MLKEGGVELGDCLLQPLGLGHVVVLERLVDLVVQLRGEVERRPDGGVDAKGVVPQVGLLALGYYWDCVALWCGIYSLEIIIPEGL